MAPLHLPLWAAFQDGARFAIADSARVVEMRSEFVGTLALTTGRIVLSDPVFDIWNPPFSIPVPPDAYPVHVALGDEDVALVLVVFQAGTPTYWEAADPAHFSSDGGTGCLMDAQVCRFLRKKAAADKFDRYLQRFQDELGDGPHVVTSLTAIPDATIVLFRTWGGDGTFPSFFGFDDDGNLLCLVLDMLVVPMSAAPLS